MPGRLLGFVSGRRTSFTPSDSKHHPLRDATSRSSSTYSLKAETQERKPSMDHIKLPSFIKHRSDKNAQHHAAAADAVKPVTLEIEFESAPLVSYGTPANSSGAHFSASLKVDVVGNEVLVDSLEVYLMRKVTVKKPVSSHCSDCASRTSEVDKWVINQQPLRLTKGRHTYPFSRVFSGDIPATTHAHLAQLDYQLVAVAKLGSGEKLCCDRPIKFARAIRPGPEKNSIRIFPPTNLTARVTMVPTIHPIGDFPVTLHISGLITKQKDAQFRWRVRKINWRIEELSKQLSHACPKHLAKAANNTAGIAHDDTRVVGEGELGPNNYPWKTDLEAGEVDCEFQACINPARTAACDVDASAPAAGGGPTVTHQLVIELVVAEEWAPNRRPAQATPTGSARILRMSFNLQLTERAGLGIAWDEEAPPVYADVPASPPAYSIVEDFDLRELEGQMDEFALGEAARPPSSSAAGRPMSWAGPSSAVAPPPSFDQVVDHPSAARSRGAITADDLLEEPSLPRRMSEGDASAQPEEDRQAGSMQ